MDTFKARDLPSALQEADRIIRELRAGRPMLFLDYDGTLTPIVNDPAQALFPDKTRNLIGRLAQNWTVVIMSGRALEEVKELVGLDNVVYAGSHGFTIEGQKGSFREGRGSEFEPALERATAELQEAVAKLRGVRLERKPLALAVHFREAGDDAVPELERLVEETAQKHQELRKTGGKRIFELRPRTDWDKGKALLYLLERLQLDDSRTVPVYIGDDETDEDAFRVIADRGVGIVVGEGDQLTAARYVLKDISAVAIFLEKLAEVTEKDVTPGHGTLV